MTASCMCRGTAHEPNCWMLSPARGVASGTVASDLDAIRERHVIESVPVHAHIGPTPTDWQPRIIARCVHCGQPWPCDTRVALDALDHGYKRRYSLTTTLAKRNRQCNAAEADAAALAEALRLFTDPEHCAALKAHEERTRG